LPKRAFPPRLVARHHGEFVGDDLHFVQRVPQQRLEQVFLVGEVQVEGAVRSLRAADHVIDAHRVQSLRAEFGEPGLQQPAHGLAALGAQHALLRGHATAQR
jgi:hypothetical protein